jgi:hypothetical protein
MPKAQFPGISEAVEKVATGLIGNPNPGLKTPKNVALDTQTGVRKGHKGVFQQAHLLSAAR